MGAVEMNRIAAVALVQRIMDADYAFEEEADRWLDMLDKGLACPTGYVSGLIFWPPERDLSADEVVDQALAYRPIVPLSQQPLGDTLG
ncbi:e9imm peptide [Streptomyces sp. NPDC021098]|uniref:e9imm peptide n=1 Tax=unclassified Streptomyces TaxID=2593676 RepID=UPI00379926FC